ncbi:MAG: PLP-dependent aminotransferase family protein [Candidatus Obscuribacterales bacterium]|nr:PLP-dependent aminotransferase family protein [Candidatus Obscuribacterales bacterium]
MRLKIKLDRRLEIDLSRQVYEQLKEAILTGRIKPGEKLPSSRELASELEVSRPTINAAFDLLSSEGFIERRLGSGTFIKELDGRYLRFKSADSIAAATTTVSELTKFTRSLVLRQERSEGSASLTNAVSSLSVGRKRFAREKFIDFQYGMPSLTEFPIAEWNRIVGRSSRVLGPEELMKSGAAWGELFLRESIANWLQRVRGLNVSPEQVIVLHGLNRAIDLTARIFLESGVSALVETPGYKDCLQLFAGIGAKVRPAFVDQEGLDLSIWRGRYGRHLERLRLIYTTPSHQFPTGVTMTLERRLELLEFARRRGAFVFEDDFDSEYFEEGKPLPALMSLDKFQGVIYCGTFNQLVFPALGLGYLVVPESLIEIYRSACSLLNEPVSLILQKCLDEFMRSGEMERSWRRSLLLYSERRKVFLNEIDRRFKQEARILGSATGVFTTVHLKSLTVAKSQKFRAEARARGVLVYPISHFLGEFSVECRDEKLTELLQGALSARDAAAAQQFIFGLGATKRSEIIRGIKILSQVYSELE